MSQRYLLAFLFSFSYILIIIQLNLVNFVNGKKCPGRCMSNITECKVTGGKIAGYCTNELACCDLTYKKIGSCGSKKSELNTAIFRSPDYPDFSKSDLICQFDFTISPNAAGIIIEFSEVWMDGRGITPHSDCESDMMFFKGFPNWTPPAQCGNLTNYAAVIDLKSAVTNGMKTFTILAVMSSNKYRWNIKVSQSFLVVHKNDSSESASEEDLPEDYYEDEYFSEGNQFDLTNEREFETTEDTPNFDTDEEVARIRLLLKMDSTPLPIQNVHEHELRNFYLSSDDDALEMEPYVVNGDDTEISSVPWQASLRQLISPRLASSLHRLNIKNCSIEEGLHFCGGTIVSDRHILSAAHCFMLGY